MKTPFIGLFEPPKTEATVADGFHSPDATFAEHAGANFRLERMPLPFTVEKPEIDDIAALTWGVVVAIQIRP